MAMRSTDGTLDFIFREPGGKERVASLKGRNLHMMIPRILLGAYKSFEAGPLPDCPQAFVESVRILDRLPFVAPVFHHPERNRIPAWIFCVCQKTARWYLPYAACEAFGPSRRSTVDDRLFVQFWDRMSFIITPRLNEFVPLLKAMKDSNLTPSSGLNKLSEWPDWIYHGGDRTRFICGSIEHKRLDLAASGDWTLTIDKRPYYGPSNPAPSMSKAVPQGMDI